MTDLDAEALVCAALRSALRPTWTDLWVSRTRTDQIPAVTVIRAGGPFGDLTDTARLMVNCYAATPAAANALAAATATALQGLARRSPFQHADVTGPQAVSDAGGLSHRYVGADVRLRRGDR